MRGKIHTRFRVLFSSSSLSFSLDLSHLPSTQRGGVHPVGIRHSGHPESSVYARRLPGHRNPRPQVVMIQRLSKLIVNPCLCYSLCQYSLGWVMEAETRWCVLFTRFEEPSPPSCGFCHIPYDELNMPFPAQLTYCYHCRRQKVSNVFSCLPKSKIPTF